MLVWVHDHNCICVIWCTLLHCFTIRFCPRVSASSRGAPWRPRPRQKGLGATPCLVSAWVASHTTRPAPATTVPNTYWTTPTWSFPCRHLHRRSYCSPTEALHPPPPAARQPMATEQSRHQQQSITANTTR